METEYDKFERELREFNELKGGMALLLFGIVALIIAFCALLYGVAWLAFEYHDILQLKNGNI